MSFNSKIKNSLYPSIYPKYLPDLGLHGVTLIRRQGIARYAVHIDAFNPDLSIATQIQAARKIIRKRTNAFWLFKEVGASIVLSSKFLPDLDTRSLAIDRTGFHAVIVQGVHIISESGEQQYNQSEWLNQTFGKSMDIAQVIGNVAI